MAFLALLLMSLYEPEETSGKPACILHPGRPWVSNRYIRYAADMNVALAYYNFLDDYEDEGKATAKLLCNIFSGELERIQREFPRQCAAMEHCIRELNRLEKDNCPNPDLPAGCFGKLMAELMVYQEDLWEDSLRKLGDALGLSQQSISRLLKKPETMTIGTLRKLCKVVEVDPAVVLNAVGMK
jgi:DNA-binding Xre family transcriptional regulator